MRCQKVKLDCLPNKNAHRVLFELASCHRRAENRQNGFSFHPVEVLMPESWPDDRDNDLPRRGSALEGFLFGALAGACAGAALRSLVAIAFIYYIQNWGGSFWGEGNRRDVFAQFGQFVFLSAGIGFFIGGLAGATCNPVVGAGLGAILSAGCCFGLVVMPLFPVLLMSGPSNTADRIEMYEALGGLAGMAFAGAAAGAIGGAVGRRYGGLR
jgi:hypothetical protein